MPQKNCIFLAENYQTNTWHYYCLNFQIQEGIYSEDRYLDISTDCKDCEDSIPHFCEYINGKLTQGIPPIIPSDNALETLIQTGSQGLY